MDRSQELNSFELSPVHVRVYVPFVLMFPIIQDLDWNSMAFLY